MKLSVHERQMKKMTTEYGFSFNGWVQILALVSGVSAGTIFLKQEAQIVSEKLGRAGINPMVGHHFDRLKAGLFSFQGK